MSSCLTSTCCYFPGRISAPSASQSVDYERGGDEKKG